MKINGVPCPATLVLLFCQMSLPVKGVQSGDSNTDYNQRTTATVLSSRAAYEIKDGQLDTAMGDLNAAIGMYPWLPEAYANRGACEIVLGKLSAAEADFDEALSFRSPSAAAATFYYMRARVRAARQERAGALADIANALGINPRLAAAYTLRASLDGNPAQASADLAKSSQLNPNQVGLLYAKSWAEENQGQLAMAERDMSAARGIDDSWQCCHQLGFIQLERGEWEDAASTYHQAISQFGAKVSAKEAAYFHIYLWVAQAEAEKRLPANPELNEYRDAVKPPAWTNSILDFLLGRIDSAQLLALAETGEAADRLGQHCEAWYYTALKLQLAGDSAAATVAFKHCIGTRVTNFIEYKMAQRALAR